MAEELSFHLRGMRFCAKAWGPVDAEPVLAVHGWLDNAASFDVLATYLKNYRIVAVDLPGHGLSDHFPVQANYNIWDDLPELLCLLNALGWQRCHLLGHSRGATVCFLLAVVAPERVCSVSMMEGLLPIRFIDEDPAVQLRNFVKDHISRLDTQPPVYSTREEAIRARAAKGRIPDHVARPIVLRSLKKHPDGWTWRTDPRLMGASAFKLGEREKLSLLKAFAQPGLLVLAEDGFAGLEELYEQSSLCPTMTTRRAPGHHHFHLDAEAPMLAQIFGEHMQLHKIPG